MKNISATMASLYKDGRNLQEKDEYNPVSIHILSCSQNVQNAEF